MTLTIVLRGDRIPTPVMASDKSLEGWARRAAPEDRFTFDGPGCFISERELAAALKALRAKRRGL